MSVAPPPLLEVARSAAGFPACRRSARRVVRCVPARCWPWSARTAGKSTLMKILAGVHQPDAGEILLDGRPVRFGASAEALARHLLIHQELNLAENLSVAANMFLGRERLPRRWLGWIDRRRSHGEAPG